ncbi:hypothetical protein FRC18_007329 [Serendipita sp. 400]|nr:hypothetical protein FRC18_007329 [Serendipita sp. 400]
MSSTDLLNTGTVCSHEACRTIDFLPFKCSHCALSFCTEHWKPTDHDCKKFDAATYDRIVPQCPFCSKPVLVAPQQDPNDAMERHIERDCATFTGKKNRGPVCGNKKCGKSLISPIVCQTCKGQFCAAHRFPNTHTCRPNQSASASTSKVSNTTTTTPSGIAALKRSAAAATNSANAKTSNVVNSITTKYTAATASSSKTPAAPSNGNNNKPTLFKEIKTDRCEPSSSSALSSPPTVPTPTANTTVLPPSLTRRPSHERKRPTVVPDPTKKWVPAALFASA